MNQKVRVFPFIKHIAIYYRQYALGVLLFSFFSALIYLLIYSFLYGYYFSGEFIRNLNTFNLIRNFVPFNTDTLAYTSLFISIVFGVIWILIRMLTHKKWYIILVGILMIVLFQISLTYFFIYSPSWIDFVVFSQIWAIPIFYISIIYLSIAVVHSVFKVISALSTSLILATWLATLGIQIPELENLNIEVIYTLLLILSINLIAFIYKKIPLNKMTVSFMNFCTVYFICLMLYMLLSNIDFVRDKVLIKIIGYEVWILIGSAFLFTIIITYLIFKFKINQYFENQSNVLNDIDFLKGKSNLKALWRLIFVEKLNSFVRLILLLLLLLLYVFTPKLSTSTGLLIRELSSTEMNEIIKVELNNELVIIEGSVVSVKGGLIYVSDRDYLLQIISAQNYILETTKPFRDDIENESLFQMIIGN